MEIKTKITTRFDILYVYELLLKSYNGKCGT